MAVTVAGYSQMWLENLPSLRPRTLQTYRWSMERHVLPCVGAIPLNKLHADDVVGLVKELVEQGYTAWTIRTILTPLSRMLTHAARRGVIPANPMKLLNRSEVPMAQPNEIVVLSKDEIAQLLHAAPPRFHSLLATAIFTGLRQSELLALRWDNIDFERQVVRVRTALDRSRKHVPLKTPKARRDVVLAPTLVRELQARREASPFGQTADYVFASQIGTPFYWRNVTRRALDRAQADAGIRRVRFHDLRHTFASMLIAQGANMLFVSQQLGHANAAITLKVYGHMFEHAEQADRTRDALEATFLELV